MPIFPKRMYISGLMVSWLTTPRGACERSGEPGGKKESVLDFAFGGQRLKNWIGKCLGDIDRPGWHIECSVMIRHYLGNMTDIVMLASSSFE